MWDIGVNTWVWTSPLTDDGAGRARAEGARVGVRRHRTAGGAAGRLGPAPRRRPAGRRWASRPPSASSMPPGRELVAADTVAETQDYLRQVVDVAAIVGSPVAAGPAYSSVGRTWRIDDRPRVYARAARRTCAPVVEYAAAARRPHRRGAAEPLRDQPAQHRRTKPWRRWTGCRAGCGLALDTYHLNIEEAAPVKADPGRRRAHRARPGVRQRPRRTGSTTTWTGPRCCGALADAGYRGPLCIESFTPDNATIATAASIWRPLADSPDALAVEGLAFLRGCRRRSRPLADRVTTARRSGNADRRLRDLLSVIGRCSGGDGARHAGHRRRSPTACTSCCSPRPPPARTGTTPSRPGITMIEQLAADNAAGR